MLILLQLFSYSTNNCHTNAMCVTLQWKCCHSNICVASKNYEKITYHARLYDKRIHAYNTIPRGKSTIISLKYQNNNSNVTNGRIVKTLLHTFTNFCCIFYESPAAQTRAAVSAQRFRFTKIHSLQKWIYILLTAFS